MDILDIFDSDRFYLGKLCPQGHSWSNTEYSLRLRTSWKCVICKQERDCQYREKNSDKIQAQRLEYRQENREILAQKQRAYYRENRDKIVEYDRNRYVQNREKKIKYQKQYYTNNREQIIIRRKPYNKIWKQENAERMRELAALWRRTERGKLLSRLAVERRRTRKAFVHSHPYTIEQYQRRFQQFDNCCAYCGAIATSIDHVIPISKGGADVLGNLLPCCRSCNSSKGCNDLNKWYNKSNPSYTLKRWRKILKVLGLTESTLGQLSLF